MAFTAARVTSLSDTDRDRLINDSLEKINAGNTFPFKEGLTDDQKKNTFKKWIQAYLIDGYAFGISKDGLLVSLFVGKIESNVFKSLYAFFGKDAGASRAYLYDNDWHNTLKSFLQSQTSLFTNFETINIENSPLASYNQAVIDAGKYTLNIEENVKENIKTNKPVIFLLGLDEIDLKNLEQAFVVYIGHHGDLNAQHADIILPSPAYTEKTSTFMNIEGRVIQTSRCHNPLGEAKEEWKIFRVLSDLMNCDLQFNNLNDVRKHLIDNNKNFLRIN